jgi:hypothetical protein
MFKISGPTLKGEIKKARASNYTWQRVISEFIDNSNDVLIKSEQMSKIIKVSFNLDTNDNLHSIYISDNYCEGITDHNIWSWTYERNREEEDCGEFGTGFKSGSVNISSELLIVTSSNAEFTRMRAEWDEMILHNDYTPDISNIDGIEYSRYHPFEKGSTFALKQLINANIPSDINYMRDELISHISIVYKKLLMMYRDINIYVDDTLINYKSVLNEINSKKIHKDENIPHSEIYVYKNKDKYVPIVKHGSQHHKIKFKDEKCHKKPNGNLNIADMRGATNGAEIVNISHYNNRDEYTLIDVLKMESRCIYHLCKIWLLNDLKERPDPNGNISLIRKNRILSDKCTAIHYRGDSYATYQYHELTYNDRRMDNPLGVQFNKNTDNKIQSEELEAAILWTQKLHEKIIMDGEGKCGQGHKNRMDMIQRNYNSLKQKIQHKHLYKLFNDWKIQVNWEEYSNKLSERLEDERVEAERLEVERLEAERLESQVKSKFTENKDMLEINGNELDSENGTSVLSYFSVGQNGLTCEESSNSESESGITENHTYIGKSVKEMTDEEIIEYVSNENTNPTLEEIMYIIDRGEGSIDGHDDNPNLYELFEIERQAKDGIRFAFEFSPDFARYLLKDYL